jgi:hypothetical protein
MLKSHLKAQYEAPLYGMSVASYVEGQRGDAVE